MTISHNRPSGPSLGDLHARGIDIFRTGFAMRTVVVGGQGVSDRGVIAHTCSPERSGIDC